MKWLLVIASLSFAADAHAKPRITMYGATWCGPCKAVRAFLSRNSVAFDYLDIDDERNRERFATVTGNERGIPLVVIDGEKARGANLRALRMILERKGVKLGAAPKPRPGAELYGGHPTSWWQTQFAALRKRLAELKVRIDEFDGYAQTNYDRDVVLKKMKDDLEILKGALDQLEIDASRVALPRRYRAY